VPYSISYEEEEKYLRKLSLVILSLSSLDLLYDRAKCKLVNGLFSLSHPTSTRLSQSIRSSSSFGIVRDSEASDSPNRASHGNPFSMA
jgi:hypothetical protein